MNPESESANPPPAEPRPEGVRVLTASEFRARCLKLMDEVAAGAGDIVITKKGRPVAQLTALRKRPSAPFGRSRGRFRIVGDIVAPLGAPRCRAGRDHESGPDPEPRILSTPPIVNPESESANLPPAAPRPEEVRVLTASEFRAKCLKLMDEVAAGAGDLVITKKGRPVARLTALRKRRSAPFGQDRGRFRIVGDIVSPLEVEWEAITDPDRVLDPES